jgi:hypothetical protein
LKTWCKLAAKKVSIGKKANDADELVIPVAKTMAREIDYLLKWKEGRTIPANRRKVVEQKVSGRKLDI